MLASGRRLLHLHVISVATILYFLCSPALTFDDLTRCRLNGVIFNCSGAGFDQVPLEEDLPGNVEVLDLSYNHIFNITEFNVPRASETLSFLYLANNKISIIKPMSFYLLTNLVFLDLSNNMIEGSKLDEHMFHDLRKLKTLKLEKNPLRIIKKDTFNFIQVPLLTHLDLSHCEISELQKSSLDLPNLEYLDLSWNLLETFSESALRMLVGLKTLDMSHNQIRVLGEVPYLPEVATWILDNNGMGEVRLRDEIWTNADSLRKLSLRNNEIIHFGPDSFPLDLETLLVLDLTNNLLHCDCKMTWIKHEEVVTEGRNITMPCKYPKELRGQNLLDIPVDELKCSVSLVHILLLVLLIVVVVLCSSLMFFFMCRRRCRRCRKATKKPPGGSADKGGNYTAVYAKDDDDDVRVDFSANRRLINDARDDEREFDV